MYQLVNMYQPVFRRQPKVLSAPTLMTIVAIVAALMLAVCLDARSTIRELRLTSANLSLNHAQLSSQLDRIASAATPSAESVSGDELEALQARITDRHALLDGIDDLFSGAGAGFGDAFETLARVNLPGLWLTGVQLDQDGSIEISGSASDPRLVPRYLQLITDHGSLESLTGATVELERNDADSSAVDFVLSYTAREAGR